MNTKEKFVCAGKCENMKFCTNAENAINAVIRQYDAVVEQNKSLQSELNNLKKTELEGSLTLREVLLMNAVAEENADIHKRIVDFLTEMSSQNNRGTAFPYIYTIADENSHFEENEDGKFFFENGEFRKIADIIENEYIAGNTGLYRNEENDAFVKRIIERIGCYDEDERVNEWLSDYCDAEGMVQRYEEEFETYYEGTFFTESDAKEYLESTMNHHFGPNPRTYVDSMNKWSRTSKTTAFLADLFKYFDVKIPPEMYYDKKKAEKETAEMGK